MREAPNLRIVHVPRHINPNFHAQHGVFTMQEDGIVINPLDPIRTWPIEKVILEFNESEYFKKGSTYLIHFTFPTELGPEIRWLLEKEQVARLGADVQQHGAIFQFTVVETEGIA